MPGVEKNANVVQNIILGNFISKSPGTVELATIICTSLLLILVLPRLSAKKGVILGFGLMGAYFVFSCILLFYQNIVVNLIFPVGNMMFIVATETVTKLLAEEKKAREIRAMFSSYVSPKIVEVLVNNPEKAFLAGERRTVTILFSDIIGFTTASEKLTPEEVVLMLNEYFQEMGETIFRWDGILDKFVGDEIMAVWGAPLDQPDHAELAVRCALNMSDRLDILKEKWRQEGKYVIDCGIGINSGEVVMGNIGWLGKKMDYTAIGNNVNVAARIEKMTRQHGSRILITENTYDMIKPVIDQGEIGHADINRIDSVKVRGKDEEVTIFSVKSLPHA
jgi:adenylate cyclase